MRRVIISEQSRVHGGKTAWVHNFTIDNDDNTGPFAIVELEDGQLDYIKISLLKVVTPFDFEVYKAKVMNVHRRDIAKVLLAGLLANPNSVLDEEKAVEYALKHADILLKKTDEKTVLNGNE